MSREHRVGARRIVICGMHRSGTSAAARVANLIGVDLGDPGHLSGPAEDNPKGFWENPDFVALDDELLHRLGGSWSSPPPLSVDARWFERADLEEQRGRAEKLLAETFGPESEVVGWKDPRASLLLPFWSAVSDIDHVVVCLRDPVDVAASLHRRNGTDPEHAAALWLRYTLDALATDTPTSVVRYADLLTDPEQVARDLAVVLELRAPSDEVLREVTEFVDPELAHGDGVSDEGPLMSAARAAFRVLDSPEGTALSPFRELLLPVVEEVATLRLEVVDRTGEVAALWTAITHGREELEATRDKLERSNEELRSAQQRLAESERRLAATAEELEALRREAAAHEEAAAHARRDYERLVSRKSVRVALRAAHYWWVVAGPSVQGFDEKPSSRMARRVRTGTRILRNNGVAGLRAIVKDRAGSARSGQPAGRPAPNLIQTLGRLRPASPSARAANSVHAPSAEEHDWRSVQLIPKISEAAEARLAGLPAPDGRLTEKTVVCLSVLDWGFRFQRPQHLMSQLADHGCRVLYVSQSQFTGQVGSYTIASVRPNLFSVELSAPEHVQFWSEPMSAANTEAMLQSLETIRWDQCLGTVTLVVQFPAWQPVAELARERWGWRVVYDCMDDWESMPRVTTEIVQAERRLVQGADAMVVSAEGLRRKWHGVRDTIDMIRNAGDYEHFVRAVRPNDLLPASERPRIGYYGAIAKWFDVGLLASVARSRPEWDFVLVGRVSDVDVARLEALPNVTLIGERPYDEMPRYLYHFDVCLIPFLENEVTAVTDPVKVYEYLAGGKPVVATPLPEIERLSEVVRFARGADQFVAAIEQSLEDHDGAHRRRIASDNTWTQRGRDLRVVLDQVQPSVSIVVVTYNNMPITRLCLQSLLANTTGWDYEVIVVDNASHDGTPAYLEELARSHARVKVIANDDNLGFAAANNQALARARGDLFVLLNNDTVTPAGWLARLLDHLEDAEVGLVGPVTNSVGNEAKIDVNYTTVGEVDAFALRRYRELRGRVADIPMLAMFCMAMRREVYDEIGPLDERFGVGMFEDDDYAVRAREVGYRVICAGDAFVHHVGEASFRKLKSDDSYRELFDRNRREYEAKWGPWQPHVRRDLDFTLHGIGEP